MIRVEVGEPDFDNGVLLAELEALGGGGVASFTGVVRGGNGLTALRLDHYSGMTEAVLRNLTEQAAARWSLLGATLIHRVGELAPGARIVFVGTASAHRAAALESCAFLIDRLKTQAPFWKQERFADGRQSWVEARHADDAAAARWA